MSAACGGWIHFDDELEEVLVPLAEWVDRYHLGHSAILDLNAICHQAEKATLGPWQSHVDGRDHTSGSNSIMTTAHDICLSGDSEAGQDCIAHARQDTPRLLAEIDQLQKMIRK